VPKLTTQVFKLCRHVRGQAFVKVAGQQIWLGRYGDALTREKYDRLIGLWLANGRALEPSHRVSVTSVGVIFVGTVPKYAVILRDSIRPVI
jgi:hypothetical protein